MNHELQRNALDPFDPTRSSQAMTTTTVWSHDQVWELDLSPDTQQRLYLPLVYREQ